MRGMKIWNWHPHYTKQKQKMKSDIAKFELVMVILKNKNITTVEQNLTFCSMMDECFYV